LLRDGIPSRVALIDVERAEVSACARSEVRSVLGSNPSQRKRRNSS
jgi:hypothetical protein